VAVLDTGVNGQHADLAGKVGQNVKLVDLQSMPTGFSYPTRIENQANTDPVAGHGTFVAGVIAASGVSSSGRFNGVAPGARLLGLSVGDVNLTNVLAGFDYLLDRGPAYNVKVVNCSFSANTVFDFNDPVNIATKMLTDRGINVVVSSGNTGPGNGTLNPYSTAPWVIGVGATDQNGVLASFSSRGVFGGELQTPTVVAPGVNVASLRTAPSTTSVGGLGGADPQRLSLAEMPFYTTASGTSFSAPQVAGAVALMLEANPTLSPAEIKDIIARTATPLPKYFQHEVGAGMLNSHAAVIEASFPNRRMGIFRSTLSRNAIEFVTSSSQEFTESVVPSGASSVNINLPGQVVQASVGISWGLSANDFGLKLFNSSNELIGQSNYLNLPGLTGRHEEIVMRYPNGQQFRSAIQHTAGVGTTQNVHGAVEVTRVEFPDLLDVVNLTPELRAQAERSLLTNVLLPEGRKFRPDSPASRFDLASAFVRAGLVSQYMAASPLFTDTRDMFTRNPVESVQARPEGKLFFDSSPGGTFSPNHSASKLIAAVAFVKAANLEGAAATASLPPTVTDAFTIPAQWRGYAAVALQRGFLTLDGSQFNPSRAVNRIEVARAINNIIQ
jgi:serine protease AprX